MYEGSKQQVSRLAYEQSCLLNLIHNIVILFVAHNVIHNAINVIHNVVNVVNVIHNC